MATKRNFPESITVQIDGTLDLHSFSPKDLKTLIPDYLKECQAKGITEVKIIHGKGKGNIRRSVHALLGRDARVKTFRLGDISSGSWGVTIVVLFAIGSIRK
jgi:dsDNA-specific endonuclease/ATPase MutS2